MCSLNALALTNVTVRIPQSDADASHDYFLQLLRKALDLTTEEFGEAQISFFPESITQKREIELLKENVDINLGWFGETQARKLELGVINIPLLNGALGHRMMAIHHHDKPMFDRIKHADTLKALVACQGSYWPDSDILEHNGYTVNRIPRFDSMYKMLSLKRCDYFPRAVSEGYSEVEKLNSEEIIAYDRILLVYPFNMKFFTHRGNETLIRRLQKGLSIMIATGQMEKLQKEHVSTRSMFPISKYENSLIFTLDNPDSNFLMRKETMNKPPILP